MRTAGALLGLPLLLAWAAPAAAQAPREQVLAELRARRLLPADARSFREEDEEFLARIRKAEAEGAVEYLYAKVRRYAPYILSAPLEEGRERYVLSAPGFERYWFHKSQDAVKAFEERGVALKEVFHLTDLAGRPFFDPQGLLTPEGEAAYDALRAGGAARWKFDWEPVQAESLPAPAAPARRGKLPPDPPEIAALLAFGDHLEVSEPEVTWLLKTGRCSVSQLEEQHLLKNVFDKARKNTRWFFHKHSIALAWVARYREDPATRGPGGTAFFGEGGGGLCD